MDALDEVVETHSNKEAPLRLMDPLEIKKSGREPVFYWVCGNAPKSLIEKVEAENRFAEHMKQLQIPQYADPQAWLINACIAIVLGAKKIYGLFEKF